MRSRVGPASALARCTTISRIAGHCSTRFCPTGRPRSIGWPRPPWPNPYSWRGFAGFMEGLFVIQARNRSMNDAIARTPAGPVDVGAECGRAGGVLASVVNRAREAGVLRPDFDAGDLATMIGAMSKVIAMSNGDDAVRASPSRFLGLTGLRASAATGSTGSLAVDLHDSEVDVRFRGEGCARWWRGRTYDPVAITICARPCPVRSVEPLYQTSPSVSD